MTPRHKVAAVAALLAALSARAGRPAPSVPGKLARVAAAASAGYLVALMVHGYKPGDRVWVRTGPEPWLGVVHSVGRNGSAVVHSVDPDGPLFPCIVHVSKLAGSSL